VSPSPSRARAQAVLTIDLGALRRNWRLLRDRAAPNACGAVVKADAYGIGLERAVAALSGAGCAHFFVAHPDEGLRARMVLREAGADARIFVLNGFAALPAAAEACAHADLIPMIGENAEAELWRDVAIRLGRRLPAALMFDTGMNRLGYDWRRPTEVARWFAERPALDVILVASHFVSSDRPDDAHNPLQIARFGQIQKEFPAVAASLANSSGLFLPQAPFFNLSRPGYALYGGNPTPGAPNPMEPIVRLEARILQVREIEAGERVGYDAQWTARRPTRLAAIGVGYADGLPRNAMATDAKLGGEAIVAGRRCPFAGRVSMDILMIDVTDAPINAIAPGAMVELLGRDISVDELGARSQTIGYEILTNLGKRYHRDYVANGD
jgi:alanine racemase